MRMDWYKVENSSQLLSPALLFYPERIQQNIQKMIAIAGSPSRLRPHIKTFKCREIIQLLLEAGVTKFKCATLAEAELLAVSGAKDVLVAYQLVGPSCAYLVKLINQFPETNFSVLIDSPSQIKVWEQACDDPIQVFLDIDCGMRRTGIVPEKAFELYEKILASSLVFKGLHIYDGHIHDNDLAQRTQSVSQVFEKVETLIKKVKSASFELVCGGSISFPIHAKFPKRQLSPGTTLLWDYGYQQNYADLDFDIAAAVFTRIISKLDDDIICVDLGHKAVASEMSGLRVYFPDFPSAKMVGHSEEHLVLNVDSSENVQIGDELIGFPWHICPTVALHEQAAIIRNNCFKEFWSIPARKRIYAL